MKIQKLFSFLLCFLNCTSSYCMEKNNFCLTDEPFPGQNLNKFYSDIVNNFFDIYSKKYNRSYEEFKKQLCDFLKSDPIFLRDNPNVCYNIEFDELMTRFVAYYAYSGEAIKYFSGKWNEFLK